MTDAIAERRGVRSNSIGLRACSIDAVQKKIFGPGAKKGLFKNGPIMPGRPLIDRLFQHRSAQWAGLSSVHSPRKIGRLDVGWLGTRTGVPNLVQVDAWEGPKRNLMKPLGPPHVRSA